MLTDLFGRPRGGRQQTGFPVPKLQVCPSLSLGSKATFQTPSPQSAKIGLGSETRRQVFASPFFSFLIGLPTLPPPLHLPPPRTRDWHRSHQSAPLSCNPRLLEEQTPAESKQKKIPLLVVDPPISKRYKRFFPIKSRNKLVFASYSLLHGTQKPNAITEVT